MSGGKGRRGAERIARRLQVRFWKDDRQDARIGFTKNVSSSGLFIGTSAPYPRGTRIRIEISDGKRTFEAEGEVVHAARVSPLLQRIRTSGMGVRLSAPNPLLEALEE